MSAKIIDGKAIAQKQRAQIAEEIKQFVGGGGRQPGLATVLVGDDPASAIYVGGKQRACDEVGIKGFDYRLPNDVGQTEVESLLAKLGEDTNIDGILLQLPVPAHLDGLALTTLINPNKDVDGLTPISAGRLLQGLPGLVPCTPRGIMVLLRECDVPLAGAHAVVVGRSNLVGKPVAQLLLAENATVTMCHSRTQDLANVCAQADVLVAAVGVPGLIGAEHVKVGATVIDVGMNRGEEGIVGDVDFDAVSKLASAITPVPGGVGPMTIAMLLRNTFEAATKANNL
jgi:methylenetetrahydrofolate dehydrogenase (NADP+)/methenyltetrahydrofolate cyclohydrolase